MGVRNMCVPLATLFLELPCSDSSKPYLEKETTHPIPSGWPFLLLGCGGGPCGVRRLPALGVPQNAGFLPTVLVPVCLPATSLQIQAVAGAGTAQYCFYCLCLGDW